MEGGIAFYKHEELSLLAELKTFTHVEISGEMLDDFRCDPDFPEYDVSRFQIRELLSRKIIADLPELPAGVCREFLNLFEARCAKMAKSGISTATLTPDISRSASDRIYAGKLRDILLCMAGIASRNDVELLFELRVPENFESALSLTRDFLKSSALFTRLLIDFHPHEPRGFDVLPQVVEMFPFKSDSWRLSFEVASCNYLSAEAVKRVAAVSRKGGRDSEYMIFAPGANTDAGNYRLLDQLAGECFKYE